MELHHLVETSTRVSRTRARLEKISLLVECLKALPPPQLGLAVTLLSGEIRQGRIGIGYATVRDVTAEPAAAPTLTLDDVDLALEELATITGQGSKGRREHALASLLARATAGEQQFLKRLLLAELRQGALEAVLLEAVARVCEVPASMVRRAVMLRGDAGHVAEIARREGASGLSRFAIELMKPLSPMLAHSADDLDDAFSRLDTPTLEYKLDGARVQVHRQGDEVRVFTRKLHDVTARVPELVQSVHSLPLRSVVLDGEAIALRADRRPHPFQVTMRRFGRRLDVDRMRQSLPLSTFYFDCLHLEGEDLIDLPGDERARALASYVPEGQRVPRIVAPDREQARAFLSSALDAGHEGVMAKNPLALYEAGRRGAGWLKVKPVRSLDLVVLAVEWGSGRRRGTLSNIHLGARDPVSGGFVMIGKTFKGMTDAMLQWQTERFLSLEIGREGHVVHVRPEQVVEIAFDGVQVSPSYEGGVALRFARVKRYRHDKHAADADTLDAVRALLPT